MMPEIFKVLMGPASSIKMTPRRGLISSSILTLPNIESGEIAIRRSGILYLNTFFSVLLGFKTRIYSAGKNPGLATTLLVKIW